MLSFEFEQFYANWLQKAERYNTQDLTDVFDRFITLYVLYNRVYAEMTFELARQKRINLSNRNSFPDSKAATDYVVQFLGAGEIIKEIENDQSTRAALHSLIQILEHEDFHILLEIVTGQAQREKDLILLQDLKSADVVVRATAIARMIYAVRCNTFHGHKQFIGVPKEILVPISIILRNLIQLVYAKLRTIQ